VLAHLNVHRRASAFAAGLQKSKTENLFEPAFDSFCVLCESFASSAFGCSEKRPVQRHLEFC